MMEQQSIREISIKKFNGRIPITSDLFEVLKNEDVVFLYHRKNEVHIMNKIRYVELLQDTKKKSWHPDGWFDWTTEGRDYMRKLCACACSIAVNKRYMALEWGDRLKKKLLWQELKIKIFS